MRVESDVPTALDGFVATWRRIVTEPRAFFADMPETGGLREPTIFLVGCAALNALGHLLVGWGIGGMVATFVAQVVGAFLLSALLVLVAQNLFDGGAGFEPTFRTVAYAAAPRVLVWVPVLGPLALAYSAYLIVLGLQRVHRFDATRAVLTLLLAVGVLLLLTAVRTVGLGWL